MPQCTLKDHILAEMIDCPGHTYFIPINHLKALVSELNIKTALQNIYPDLVKDKRKLQSYTATILRNSKCVFAILITGDDSVREAVRKFVDEGITDADLPFCRVNTGERENMLCVKEHRDCRGRDYRVCGHGVQAISKWGSWPKAELDRRQWFFQAPEFRRRPGAIPHFDIHESSVMPFTENYEQDDKWFREGGYSVVWAVRIHPAHHNLWTSSDPKGPLLAIKRLYSRDHRQFERETDFLTDLSMQNHPHLIELLATYKFKSQYHLVFPHANENLRDYWNSVSSPYWNTDTCLWFLQQIHGLVSALNTIHNFQIRNPEVGVEDVNPNFERFSRSKGIKLRTDGPEKFGRHGDLKPENILRSELINTQTAGVLQITDFGLGRFHRFESRSVQDPKNITGSPTYAPPELALGRHVSRAYDIWSLGCVFLEFITWLLEGSAGLDKFNAERTMQGEDGVVDDVYFTLSTSPNGRVNATTREEVTGWIDHLRQSRRRSKMTLEFLNVIEKNMIKVESGNRIRCHELVSKTERILSRGYKDEEYLLGRDTSVVDQCSGMRQPQNGEPRSSKVRFQDPSN